MRYLYLPAISMNIHALARQRPSTSGTEESRGEVAEVVIMVRSECCTMETRRDASSKTRAFLRGHSMLRVSRRVRSLSLSYSLRNLLSQMIVSKFQTRFGC